MVKRFKTKWMSLFLFLMSLFVLWPQTGLAQTDTNFVSRREMLDVAKEIHPPGCTDSMTADYCMLPTGYETRQEITSLLQTGMNKKEVLDFLVEKYGDRILASPLPEGFNLVVWLLPGLGLVLGAILVTLFIRKRRRSEQWSQTESHPVVLAAEDASRVSEELKKWL